MNVMSCSRTLGFRFLLFNSLATSLLCHSNTFKSACAMSLRSVDFEIFGKVQGVFFRKYTQETANRLGLKGWCMNTEKGTVQGTVEGPSKQVEDMLKWLKNTGSRESRIDRAEFKNDKSIHKLTYDKFEVRR